MNSKNENVSDWIVKYVFLLLESQVLFIHAIMCMCIWDVNIQYLEY